MQNIRCSLRRALVYRFVQSRPAHVYRYPAENRVVVVEKVKERIKYGGNFARSKVKLSAADEELLSRGDFMGIQSLGKKSYKMVELEVAVGRFQEQIHINRRISAEHLFVDILIPLESKDAKMVAAILKNPDYYVPALLRFCGSALTSIHLSKRKVILSRLISAFELNENEDYFNVDQVWREVELNKKMTPDIRFFNNLLWQLAYNGDHLKLDEMMTELAARGIRADANAQLAMIYCNERQGLVLKTDSMIRKYAQMFGASRMQEAIAAACCGSAAGHHIDRLRTLLRMTVQVDGESGRKVSSLAAQSIFDIIWSLAKTSKDGMGREWLSFTQQLLESANRTAGFFKLLVSAAEKHIQHGYFYSAAAILGDTLRVRDSLTNQRRGMFMQQLLTSFVNRMVQQNVETKTMIELANRIVATFGPTLRVWDDIVYAILTYKVTTPQERFEQFCAFVDLIDPERERIHIILPLLTTCGDPMDKCKMLFRCSRIGYTNIAELNAKVIAEQIVLPLLESQSKNRRVSDHVRLDYIADSIKTFGIPGDDVWKLMWNVCIFWMRGRCMPVSFIRNFQQWLKLRKKECFPAKDPFAEQEFDKMDFAMLTRLVDARDVEGAHAFLLKRGFPPDTDFETITEPLIHMYTELANWGYLQKLLHMLSKTQKKTVNYAEMDPTDAETMIEGQVLEDVEMKSFVTNYHLLHILRRKLDEMPKDAVNVNEMVEYVYELKRLFPSAVSTHETFMGTIGEYRRLFRALILMPFKDSIRNDVVDPLIELLSVLVRMEIIHLHSNETLTPFIVANVLRRGGWVEAVETWLRFQGVFFCSNGILELLTHAVKENNNHKIQFLIHRARNVMTQPKIMAWLASCYIAMDRLDDARELIRNCEKRPHAFDMLSVFRVANVMNANVVARNRGVVAFPKYYNLSFVRLALDFTDLKDNKKALNMCHTDWLSQCVRLNEGLMAQRFIDLFGSYGVELGDSVRSTAQEVIDWHNALVELRDADHDEVNVQNNHSYLKASAIPHLLRPVRLYDRKAPKCSLARCFDFSKCPINSQPKVYVYPTDVEVPISEVYAKILRSIRESSFYTENPKDACLFVLSLDTVDRDRLSDNYVKDFGARLSALPQNLWNGGRNHLIFNLYYGNYPEYSQTDLGFDPQMAMMAWASADMATFRDGFDISFPLFHKEHPLRSAPLLSSFGDPFNDEHLISFKGKRYVYGIGSSTRDSLYHLNNHNSTVIVTTCRHNTDWKKFEDERCEADNREYDRYDYAQLLVNSTFCLTPRGRRLGSFRFLESLKAQCIPVVLSDGWELPFSEIIDWSKAAIHSHEASVFFISDYLRSIPAERIIQMKLETQRLYHRYFGSVEKIVITTLETIFQRLSNIPPKQFELANAAEYTFVIHAAKKASNRLSKLLQLTVKFNGVKKMIVFWPKGRGAAPEESTIVGSSRNVVVNIREVNDWDPAKNLMSLSPKDFAGQLIMNIDERSVNNAETAIAVAQSLIDAAAHLTNSFLTLHTFSVLNNIPNSTTTSPAYLLTPQRTNSPTLGLLNLAAIPRTLMVEYLESRRLSAALRQIADSEPYCHSALFSIFIADRTLRPPVQIATQRLPKALSAVMQQQRHLQLCLQKIVRSGYDSLPLLNSTVRYVV